MQAPAVNFWGGGGSKNNLFWTAFFLHIIIFLCLYGVSSLDVGYTDWMIDSGDLGLEFFGALFYARSEWGFPVGLMDGLTYPYDKSVVYFDALPVLAIIGKLIKGILPDKFQLWGIYSFLVFGLQGGLGACCIHRFVMEKRICIAGSFFFSMQMIFLSNIYKQIPLSSHWILLCTFLIALYYGELKQTKKVCFTAAICTTTLFVQTAFLPMVLCIFFFAMTAEMLVRRSFSVFVRNIVCMGAGLLCIGCSAWILGMFYSDISMAGGGLGNAAVRLDSFLDPMGGSLFLPARSDYKLTAAAYLGLGTIVMFCITMALFVAGILRRKRNYVSKNEQIYLACAFLAAVICVFFALSPTAKWGDRIIYDIPVNEAMYKLWSTVRSSYRLVWPVVYGIVIFSVWFLHKLKKKHFNMIIVFCALLQVADLTPFISKQRDNYLPKVRYVNPLHSDAWDELAESKDKLIFMNGDNRNNAMSLIHAMERPQIYSFADYAYENEMKMSDFYYARKDSECMNITRSRIWEDLYAGNIDEKAVYIFMEAPARLIWLKTLNYYWIDNYLVGIGNELSDSLDYVKYEDGDPVSILPITTERAIDYLDHGACDGDGVRVVYPGGKSYGPCISLDAGTYKICITGENLMNTDICCVDKEDKHYVLNHPEIRQNQIVYEVDLDKLAYGIEFIVENNSGKDIQIHDITIEKNAGE